MKIVKAQLTTLAAPLGSTDMAFTLTKLLDSQGNALAFSDFDSDFIVFVAKSGDTTEIIKASTFVVNDDGTVSVTVAGSGRDILPKSPYTGGSTGQDFPAGADVIMTNDPLTMSTFVQEDVLATFSVTPRTTAGDPTDPTEFTRKAYVDALVLGQLTTIDVIVPGKAGATVAAGNLVYFDEATGKWKLADADIVSTVTDVLLGIAQGAGTDGNAIANGVLLQGVDANQTGMTIGNVMYASNTPGGISASPGTETVTVGIAKDATNLYFAPRFNMQLTKAGNDFLLAVTGMSFMWNGDTAPSGFLMEDGTAYANQTYQALVAVLKGKFGVGAGTAFTANASTDVISSAGHGLAAGQILLLDSTTTLPAGLSQYTLYYVINPTTDTFQLATSAGGSAVNITDTGTGTHSYHTQFKVPDSRGRVPVGAGTGVKTATIVSVAGNVLTVSGLSNIKNEFQTGQAVVFTAGVAGNLANGVTYYVVRVSNSTFSLATSLANAQNGTLITLAGTETGSFALTFTARSLGDTFGEETHAITSTEMLAHHHEVDLKPSYSSGSAVRPAFGNPSGTDIVYQSGDTGGNNAMNNTQPSGVKTYIIKT